MEESARANPTLAELAQLVDGTVVGDATRRVTGVAPVEEASGEQIAFLSSKRYVKHVERSAAGAFLVSRDLAPYVPDGTPCVVVDAPYPALREVLVFFHPQTDGSADVHPTAVIGRGVRLGDDVAIGPYAVLDDGVSIGDGSRIGAHCVVGRDSTVGERCLLHPHVVVYHGCSIGDRVILHSGVRIGSDGYGYTLVDGQHLKIPQVGRAIVEDDVEIGANTTVDRGSLGDTLIGRGSKVDNLVQLAHNVRVGALTLISALVGVAGSSRIGSGVWLGGQTGVSSHLNIGDGAKMAIATKVMRDVPDGETMSGHPGRPHREQLRAQAHMHRLPKLVERVERLEAALAASGTSDG